MCDCQSTYLKGTILSSQFLGLKQGNWAKCMTFDPPISKELYQINFLSWSRAIGQNIWLSIHLSHRKYIIESYSWVEAGQLGKMYDYGSTYLKINILLSQFYLVEAGQLGKMCDCQSTYLKGTILSSQFLGLKQGNWAKYIALDSPISIEPHYQVNFLGWSRAILQNVWLSIHLSQKNHIIKSISWVGAGQLGKMYDCRSTYPKKNILSCLFLGL